MQRQVASLTRKTLRASNKLVKAAAFKRVSVSKQSKVSSGSKALTLRKPSVAKPSAMRGGMAMGPAGPKRYYVHRPAGKAAARKLSLVVMLHGCAQDAHSFAASTRMNGLAAAAGFVVVYPEQDRLANVQACWNWFDTRSGRAQREAAGILAVVDQVCATYPIDAAHIVVAGMSAGAGNKNWRAYLSTTANGSTPAVNARDRIGRGPWQNAKGVTVATSVDDLHSANNQLSKGNSLTETGTGISGRGDAVNLHDILTGSTADGRVDTSAPDTTCGNWTKSGEGSAVVGHHDRVGLNDSAPMKSWNASHATRGCSLEALKSTGGGGLMYCFAAN